MPKALHNKLLAQANKQGLTGEHRDAYVYGTMARIEAAKKKKKKRNPLLAGRG